MAPVSSDPSSLSVQERHRAMAAMDLDPVEAGTEEALEPAETNEPTKSLSSSPPKRSSVIDMWKKRESTIIAASTANIRSVGVLPKPSNEKDHIEEKKEASPEENDPSLVDSKSATESAKSSMPGGAPTRSKIRGMWKQKESVVKSAVTPKPFVPEQAPEETEETTIQATEEITTEATEEITTQAPEESTSQAVNQSRPPASPVKRFPPSPRVAQSSPRISQSESPSAFNELRNKWKKFGVDKEEEQVTTRTSPASGFSKSSPSSSLVEKGRLALQKRRQSPVIMGEEDSSIDGGATPRTPSKAPTDSPSAVMTSLQQPVLEVDSDGFPKMPQKTTPKREQVKKMGQLHAGRSKVLTPTGQSPTGSGTYPITSANSFSRRKHLFERHRRRGMATSPESESADKEAKAATASTTEHSRAESTTSDLSQAFRAAGIDEDFAELSRKLAGTDSQPRAQDGPKINIDTLMSFAGNDPAQGDGKSNSSPSEYSSLQVSNSFNKQDTPKSYSSDFFSDPDINVDDHDLGRSVASTRTRSTTSIASRAHETLRGKRRMKRAAEEQARTKTAALHQTEPYAKSSATNASSVSASSAGGTYDSETISTTTQTVESEAYSKKESGGLTPTAETMVTDKFVEASNANVEAFASSLQAISLGQIANDVSDVISGVDLKSLNEGVAAATHHLNEGMAAASLSISAASESLSKIVASLTPKSKQPDRVERVPSLIEEIAIEVEYVEDSDDET